MVEISVLARFAGGEVVTASGAADIVGGRLSSNTVW
jgi:hypothetical protein